MSAPTIELTEADKNDLSWFGQGVALENAVALIVERHWEAAYWEGRADVEELDAGCCCP